MSHIQRSAGNAATTHLLTVASPPRRRRPAVKREQEDGLPTTETAVMQRAVVVQRGEEDQQSPEEQFLDDLDSGLGKAKEYLEYIPTAVEWWQKVGGDAPAGLLAAADNLAKISTRISEGVDQYSKIVGKAKQVLQVKRWAEGVWDVAQSTRALTLSDKSSRDAWIKSVDRLGKLSGPFVDAAKDWLKSLAIGGGMVASRAFIVLSALTAYAEIGWAGLKAGIAAVEAYTGRFGYEGSEMRKIEEAERGITRPPEPGFPGSWVSAGERQAEARAARQGMERAEQARKRRERLAPFRAKVDEARTAVDATKRLFDDSGFAKAYQRRRGTLVADVSREMRSGKQRLKLSNPRTGESASIERGVGSRWYDQFISADVEAVEDPVAGMWVTPVKARINLEEAQREIDNFRTVQPTCPTFNTIYAEELQKFTLKASAALALANEQYARAAAAAD